MGWRKLEQPILLKGGEEIGEIGAKQIRGHIVFVEQLTIGRVDTRCGREQLPHAGADFVQTEVTLGIEIEEDGFLVEHSHHDVRRHDHAVRKLNHTS
jgi:hypothetical protein